MSESYKRENDIAKELSDLVINKYINLMLYALDLGFVVENKDAYSIIDSADDDGNTYLCLWTVFEFDIIKKADNRVTNFVLKMQTIPEYTEEYRDLFLDSFITTILDTIHKIDSGEITQPNAMVVIANG